MKNDRPIILAGISIFLIAILAPRVSSTNTWKQKAEVPKKSKPKTPIANEKKVTPQPIEEKYEIVFKPAASPDMRVEGLIINKNANTDIDELTAEIERLEKLKEEQERNMEKNNGQKK